MEGGTCGFHFPWLLYEEIFTINNLLLLLLLYYYYLLRAYSPVNRTGSPQGFSLV